jgi:hypothetical protein
VCIEDATDIDAPDDTNLSNLVINEALDFIDIIKDTISVLYQTCISQENIDMLDEDFYKVMVSSVIKGKVYKIITILSRVDNEICDKDLRYKFKELKHV